MRLWKWPLIKLFEMDMLDAYEKDFLSEMSKLDSDLNQDTFKNCERLLKTIEVQAVEFVSDDQLRLKI